jgi:hypothetical protein
VSGATLKLEGWTQQPEPPEDSDKKFHRQLLTEVVFGLFYRKKQKLKEKEMPPQPIHLREIWLEFQSRRQTLMEIDEWPHKIHSKRWIDRRVNEIASPKFAHGRTPMVVSASAGWYQPNPKLFSEEEP